MERLLARLERRLGKLAVENVAAFVVGGMGLVFLLSLAKPEFEQMLTLDPQRVLRGEVWRLVTYLFLPPTHSLLGIVFELPIVWTVLRSLETSWGAFRLNAYYVLGALGTTLAALLVHGAVGNWYLNLSLFLAFATLFPAYEILFMFVAPVKMKWLGWVAAAYLGYELFTGSWPARGAVVASLLNYLLFFGGDLMRLARSRQQGALAPKRDMSAFRQASPNANVVPRQPREVKGGRRAPVPSFAIPEKMSGRSCALCGAREDDGAEIRVCSCAKCQSAGGTRALCLEHARNH